MSYAVTATIAANGGFRNRLIAALTQRASAVLVDSDSGSASRHLARDVLRDSWETAGRIVWTVASHAVISGEGVDEDGEVAATDEHLDGALDATWNTIAEALYPAQG